MDVVGTQLFFTEPKNVLRAMLVAWANLIDSDGQVKNELLINISGEVARTVGEEHGIVGQMFNSIKKKRLEGSVPIPFFDAPTLQFTSANSLFYNGNFCKAAFPFYGADVQQVPRYATIVSWYIYKLYIANPTEKLDAVTSGELNYVSDQLTYEDDDKWQQEFVQHYLVDHHREIRKLITLILESIGFEGNFFNETYDNGDVIERHKQWLENLETPQLTEIVFNNFVDLRLSFSTLDEDDDTNFFTMDDLRLISDLTDLPEEASDDRNVRVVTEASKIRLKQRRRPSASVTTKPPVDVRVDRKSQEYKTTRNFLMFGADVISNPIDRQMMVTAQHLLQTSDVLNMDIHAAIIGVDVSIAGSDVIDNAERALQLLDYGPAPTIDVIRNKLKDTNDNVSDFDLTFGGSYVPSFSISQKIQQKLLWSADFIIEGETRVPKTAFTSSVLRARKEDHLRIDSDVGEDGAYVQIRTSYYSEMFSIVAHALLIAPGIFTSLLLTDKVLIGSSKFDRSAMVAIQEKLWHTLSASEFTEENFSEVVSLATVLMANYAIAAKKQTPLSTLLPYVPTSTAYILDILNISLYSAGVGLVFIYHDEEAVMILGDPKGAISNMLLNTSGKNQQTMILLDSPSHQNISTFDMYTLGLFFDRVTGDRKSTLGEFLAHFQEALKRKWQVDTPVEHLIRKIQKIELDTSTLHVDEY
jgi:hypothetical protein